jgi:hypothetical protein
MNVLSRFHNNENITHERAGTIKVVGVIWQVCAHIKQIRFLFFSDRKWHIILNRTEQVNLALVDDAGGFLFFAS